MLLAANANGGVEHWHVSSGKLLHAFPVKDDSNQVYALDYDQNGIGLLPEARIVLLESMMRIARNC